MSSDLETKCDGLFNDTLIMMPEYDDEVAIRHGDRRGWQYFPGNGWKEVINRHNPQRVIVNPFWRHRIGTILEICDEMSGGWVQICPPGDMTRVCDDVPARGGPITVNFRMKACLRDAMAVESGNYQVSPSHPLRPVFDWGLFSNNEQAAQALLWLIDPRLFINPFLPEKGWKRRIHKAMGVGVPFKAAQRMFNKFTTVKFDLLHQAWANCSIVDIPCQLPADSPARWIRDFYLKTRGNLVDRPGDVSCLNRFAAIITCRRLINFICESWVYGMYAGNYPLLSTKDYICDPLQRSAFDNLLSSYCEQLDGCHTAG